MIIPMHPVRFVKPPEDFGWWEHFAVRPMLRYKNKVVRALVIELCGYDPVMVANLVSRVNQLIRLMPPNNGPLPPASPLHTYKMAKMLAPTFRALVCHLDPEYARMQGYIR